MGCQLEDKQNEILPDIPITTTLQMDFGFLSSRRCVFYFVMWLYMMYYVTLFYELSINLYIFYRQSDSCAFSMRKFKRKKTYSIILLSCMMLVLKLEIKNVQNYFDIFC